MAAGYPFKYAIGRWGYTLPPATNIVSNPGADDGTVDNWGLFDAVKMSLVADSAAKTAGAYGFKLTCNSSTSSCHAYSKTTTNPVVGLSTKWAGRVWVRAPSGNSAIGKTCYLTLLFCQDGDPGVIVAALSQSAVLSTTWQQIQISGTAGTSLATQVRLRVGLATASTGNIVWFDQAELYAVDTADTAGDFMVPATVEEIGYAGTESMAGYPASNTLVEKLSRSWRAVWGAGDRVLSYWMSNETVRPAAVYIEGANVAAITLERSTTSNGTAGNTTVITLTKNPMTGRYGAFYEIPSGFGFGKYWRLRILNAQPVIPAHLEHFEIMRVTWIETLNSMAQNWGVPYDVRASRIGGHVESPDGSFDSVDSSGVYTVMSLGNVFDRSRGDGIEAQLQAMAQMAYRDRILMYENNGDNTRCWLCAKIGEMPVTRDTYPRLRSDVVLREVL